MVTRMNGVCIEFWTFEIREAVLGPLIPRLCKDSVSANIGSRWLLPLHALWKSRQWPGYW